jgi:glutamate dehydrogenase
MSITHQQHSVLLEQVFSLINEKVDASQASKVIQFGNSLLKTMSFEDLNGRSDSDLYGAILSLWQLLQDKKDAQPSIKVFNPEIAKHGWQSSHTIIQVIVDDMPFLVDSIRMAINRSNITSHLILHNPMHFFRDKKGKVSGFVDKSERNEKHSSETVFLIEIDRQARDSDLKKLAEELRTVISEVSLSVADWQSMREKLSEISQDFDKSKSKASESVKSQCKTFLNWLNNHNFTLMG